MRLDTLWTNARLLTLAPDAAGLGLIERAAVGAVGGRIALVAAMADLPAGVDAADTFDCEGRLVTPGWVDVHTHYDGQATWDPVLAPSSWHGATTIVFVNCGVGFAPVRQQHQQALIELMEGVEDIPGTALAEGLTWGWESFPEYLDVLDRMHWALDVGAQVPHAGALT